MTDSDKHARPARPDSDALTNKRRRILGECRVDTFRAQGSGGQNLHKTESAVRLTHLPTGLTALASDTRSQTRNRELALDRLMVRIARLTARPKPRLATRVPSAERRRRIEDKRRRSGTKTLRGKASRTE